MRRVLMISLLAFGFVFGFLLPRIAKGDDIYGRIRGTVTDPTGAVIAGAKVTGGLRE